jgi:hypothetical protein
MEQQKLLERRQAVLAVENCICYKPDRGDAICQTRRLKKLEVPRENKSKIHDKFFALKKCPSTHHVYHAIHHKLTIKNQVLHPIFCKTPCKNTKTRLHKISAQTPSSTMN